MNLTVNRKAIAGFREEWHKLRYGTSLDMAQECRNKKKGEAGDPNYNSQSVSCKLPFDCYLLCIRILI